jgi:hypothetical protein
MKRILLTLMAMIVFSACSAEVIPTPTPEPVVEEVFEFEQVRDNGNIYTSKDFFDAGFKEYKEYNVSKLTGAIEAWYGYWGPDEDSVRYYELRFYPDHSTAVSEGTSFAENATGDDAKLRRQDTMWRVGLSDRKRSSSALDSHPTQRAQALEVRLAKYADYMIFDNVIILCEGENSKESFKLCNDLINLLKK